MTRDRQRVLVIGGGMAGMTAAWQLSQPCWRDRTETVTVLQRDGLIGGKGASTRGPQGRIQEHGLHVWLGYYDNAFRLLRDVYADLDRPTSDPACSLSTVEDAFEPVDAVGVVEDHADGTWDAWLARFAEGEHLPGEPSTGPIPSMARQMAHNLGLLASVLESLGPAPAPARGVHLTSSPHPPRTAPTGEQATVWWLELAELATLMASVRGIDELADIGGAASSAVSSLLGTRLDGVRRDLLARLDRDDRDRRFFVTTDLLLTAAIGALRDGLIGRAGAHRRVDHLDFREWLRLHGAHEVTCSSPILRGMYDLVFAYESGARNRPRFAAGLGLVLATRFFFSYRGALFWRMRAGMGDVVFAPMVQALRGRGVRFEHFTEAVELVPDGRGRITAITVQRHASLRPNVEAYDPLVRIDGLPCFREAIDHDQVEVHEPRLANLRAGEDFDVIVLAASLADLPAMTGLIRARSPRWRAMIERVGTVGTRSVQLWATGSRTVASRLAPGVVLSGFGEPFDTCASMEHLLPRETWSEPVPTTLVYLCGAVPDGAATDGEPTDAPTGAVTTALARLGLDANDVVARYDSINDDGSARYVQSLPGSSAHRLRVDESGFENLVLAGDWTACGLEAGCIEAAVLSGLQAANAIIGRPLDHGQMGGWDLPPKREPT